MKVLRFVLGAAMALSSVGAAQSAVLLVDGSLRTTNDLTRIEDGGSVFEYLDYTSTVAFDSVAAALDEFGSDGFKHGDYTGVQRVLGAFGITTPATAPAFGSSFATLSVTQAQGAAYTSAFGTTFGSSSSLATYAVSDTINGGFCISVAGGACAPDNFIEPNFDYKAITTGLNFSPSTGVFLVREVAPVPLPASAVLLITGIAGLFGASRLKKTS